MTVKEFLESEVFKLFPDYVEFELENAYQTFCVGEKKVFVKQIERLAINKNTSKLDIVNAKILTIEPWFNRKTGQSFINIFIIITDDE